MLLLLILFLLSGFTGLVYEVLWLHHLGLILGHSAHAAALTLVVFFAGLSAGSFWWGSRASRSENPLLLYALLEVAVGLAALWALALFREYESFYPRLFPLASAVPALLLGVQSVLAAAALFPPAFLMGGTLPAMAQHIIRRADELGPRGSLLYAINTAGGAAGALVAGFYLPVAFGFANAYLLAVGLSFGIGLLAWAVGRSRLVTPNTAARQESASPGLTSFDGPQEGSLAAGDVDPGLSRNTLLILAALSGFVALGLEVLWTLMFAQVLHNSVYSFALILFTFLFALGLGALLAHGLARSSLSPQNVLFHLLVVASLAVGTTPFLFRAVTGELAYVAPDAGWGSYIAKVLATVAATILIPGTILGAVFPYLLRLQRRTGVSVGAIIGRLTAANTLGAILGSLLAGFALLPWLGLWPSIRAFALLHVLAALLVGGANGRTRPWHRVIPAGVVVLFVTVLDPSRLPILRSDPKGRDCVYEVWQSRYGVVSVVRSGDNLRTKVDNYYSLGGTAARSYEETQADIPLVIHPRPARALFLGLGTGITAGAALRHPIEHLTAVELIPEVVTAARKYFADYTNGLFTDPRATIVTGDGRNHLLGSAETYDVIVSDLFIPWQAGAGSLYTREQFELARRRLAPGGLFAQWLPLYQLSRREAFIIIRTMLEVFPQVTLWRGDFLPHRPIVTLVGETAERALDADALVENFRRRRRNEELPRERIFGLMGMFYAGNLSANRQLFDSYPINTDDRPIIEYSSPITQREERRAAATWFTSLDLLAFQRELLAHLPPDRDPYLSRLRPGEANVVRAGLQLFAARALRKAGREAEAAAATEEFNALVPPEVAQTFKKQIEQWSTPRREGETR